MFHFHVPLVDRILINVGSHRGLTKVRHDLRSHRTGSPGVPCHRQPPNFEICGQDTEVTVASPNRMMLGALEKGLKMSTRRLRKDPTTHAGGWRFEGDPPKQGWSYVFLPGDEHSRRFALFFFQYTPLKALASMGLESDSKGAPKDWTQLLSTPPDEKPEPGQDSKKNRNLTGCLEDG